MTIAIITDNCAIFPSIPFVGQDQLHIVSLPIQNDVVKPLQIQDFARLYCQLESSVNGLLVLTSSSSLLLIAESAQAAALSHVGKTRIAVVDSQHTGAALGILVKIACQAAQQTDSLMDIERQVRAAIPRLYHLIVASAPESLARHGLLHPAQASALQVLKISPAYTLEEGQLNAFTKIRSRRHLLETFLEFIEEFNHPLEISFSRAKECSLRAGTLRATAVEFFPRTPFYESEFSPAITTLFGSSSASITILDN